MTTQKALESRPETQLVLQEFQKRRTWGQLIIAAVIILSLSVMGILIGLYASNPSSNPGLLYGIIALAVLLVGIALYLIVSNFSHKFPCR
jgi:zinc transporter ZupT